MKVGDAWEAVLVERLTRTQIVMYAGASGDFHPLHHDDVHARAAGYPGIFAHGMLTMGMTGRFVTDVVGAGRLTRYGARLLAQVWPEDTLTASMRVVAIDDGLAELSVRAVNQDGVEVLAGSATARIS